MNNIICPLQLMQTNVIACVHGGTLVDKSFMVPCGKIVELQRRFPREVLVARLLRAARLYSSDNLAISPRGTINDLSTSLAWRRFPNDLPKYTYYCI